MVRHRLTNCGALEPVLPARLVERQLVRQCGTNCGSLTVRRRGPGCDRRRLSNLRAGAMEPPVARHRVRVDGAGGGAPGLVVGPPAQIDETAVSTIAPWVPLATAQLAPARSGHADARRFTTPSRIRCARCNNICGDACSSNLAT